MFIICLLYGIFCGKCCTKRIRYLIQEDGASSEYYGSSPVSTVYSGTRYLPSAEHFFGSNICVSMPHVKYFACEILNFRV